MYLWRACPPQLFRTGVPRPSHRETPPVLSLTHPAPPVQTALHRASPCCVLLRHAAPAGQRRAVAAAGDKMPFKLPIRLHAFAKRPCRPIVSLRRKWLLVGHNNC